LNSVVALLDFSEKKKHVPQKQSRRDAKYSLLNNKRTKKYYLLAKNFGCSPELKLSWLIVLSQILFTFN